MNEEDKKLYDDETEKVHNKLEKIEEEHGTAALLRAFERFTNRCCFCSKPATRKLFDGTLLCDDTTCWCGYMGEHTEEDFE
jgi:hypothetical protein